MWENPLVFTLWVIAMALQHTSADIQENTSHNHVLHLHQTLLINVTIITKERILSRMENQMSNQGNRSDLEFYCHVPMFKWAKTFQLKIRFACQTDAAYFKGTSCVTSFSQSPPIILLLVNNFPS